MNTKIPVYKPYLTKKEQKYVNECLESTWISSKGKFIEKFEKEFAKYINVKYARTCSNGTTALHLALIALEIKNNDEVIVPTFTYVASVNAIKMCNATPVFIDSLPKTLQMDSQDIERKITEKTKAIIIPHLYGHSADLNKIMSIAKKNKLYVIEDCAESFGTLYKRKHVGTFGDIATFSFFGNKTITTGEGGMIISNNKLLANKINHIKAQGLENLNPEKQNKTREYWHDIVGYNYRMTNICAAIGLAQLERADKIIKAKRSIADLYYKNLNKDEIFMLRDTKNIKNSYWMITILFKNNKIVKKIRKVLKQNNIETRPLFPEVHKMPMYDTKEIFPNAKNISERGINLPSYPELKKEEIEKICKIINYNI